MEKKISIEGHEVKCRIDKEGGLLVITMKDHAYKFNLLHAVRDFMVIEDVQSGLQFQGHVFKNQNGAMTIDLRGRSFVLEETKGATVREKEIETRPRAPMPGKILKVLKVKGDKVKKGDALITMEAMKMEHTIRAGLEGVIKEVFCKPGELVTGGMELLSYE